MTLVLPHALVVKHALCNHITLTEQSFKGFCSTHNFSYPALDTWCRDDGDRGLRYNDQVTLMRFLERHGIIFGETGYTMYGLDTPRGYEHFQVVDDGGEELLPLPRKRRGPQSGTTPNAAAV